MHYLRSWINAELQLGLLAVVDREALHEEGGEPGPGAPTEGVEDKETLQQRNETLLETLQQRNETLLETLHKGIKP